MGRKQKRKTAESSGGEAVGGRDRDVVSKFRDARTTLAALPGVVGIRSDSHDENKPHMLGCFSVFLTR
jgi:hypothetical protein